MKKICPCPRCNVFPVYEIETWKPDNHKYIQLICPLCKNSSNKYRAIKPFIFIIKFIQKIQWNKRFNKK